MSAPVDAYEPRFPPFPVYDGVSFKDFVESGIRLRSDADGIERDGMNVPTVSLSKRHEMDQSKTDATNHKIAFQHVIIAQNVAKANLPWWQQWEADEAARGDSIVVDPKQDMCTRFQHAAETFTRTKKWPSPSPNNNVRRVWDEFQKFVGLAGPAQTKLQKKAEEEEISDDEDDDDVGAQVGPDPDDLGNQKMMEFLADPAYGLKVFFSTYMKDRGLIWNEANLSIAPKLISFFIQFIIRNRIFNSKDKKVNKGLEDAKKVIELAAIELPLTSKLANAFPDELSLALKEFMRAPAVSAVSIEMPVDEDHIISTENPDLDAALANAGVSIISAEDIDMTDATTMASEAPTWGSVVADGDSASGWGSEVTGGESGWGSEATAEAGWGAAEAADAGPTWGEWTPPSIFPLLGPTALPLTHTSGYTEFSVRRIKSVSPPDTSSTEEDLLASSPDPVAVERVLEQQFHKVVLSPWPDWTNPADPPNEDCLPHFTPNSREHATPHNPARDDITVLVTSTAAEQMAQGIGMGIGGEWAQLARMRDLKGAESQHEPAKTTYWYSEGTILSLMSFNAYPVY